LKASIYTNTKTTLPDWVDDLHVGQPQGYGYEHGNFFIHIYGQKNDLWVQFYGLTASQQKTGSLDDWLLNTFGATNIKESVNDVGNVVDCVWRPGLYYPEKIYQALSTNEFEQRSAEQALRLLIDYLDNLFIYIEPSTSGLQSYSHKTRELLILACTEVENYWTQYLNNAGATPSSRYFNTTDYVKLCAPLFLREYELNLRPYVNVGPIKPFENWHSSKPTQSLGWYNAYNKTKHNKSTYFSEATLQNCIEAIMANIVMFCVRFSPYPLFSDITKLSGIMNQLFSLRLDNPDPSTFYVAKVNLPASKYNPNLVCGETKDYIEPWQINPLRL